MPQKQVRLRDDHYEFLDENSLSLSGMLQNALDEVQTNERDLPERNRRATVGYDLVRTTVSIDEDHAAFINDHDFVFSIFVHDLIEERIEDERKLDELGE